MKTTRSFPFVSIVIPCRNEETFIRNCLDSVIANDYSKERMELFVVDGMSQDSTRDIVKRYARVHPWIVLLDNPKKLTPYALNIGVKQAKGEVIMRMDAHSVYKHNYISSCIKYSKEYGADNVGGIFAATPFVKTLVAKSIAFVMSHPFGVGNSYFRTYPKHIQEVDTVAFGCYKREVFDKIGLFNENLERSQDMEFNIRLKKAGGKIILFPNIIAYYYTDPTVAKFVRHNFKDGVWAILPAKFTHALLRPRHLVPLVFMLVLLLLALLSFSHIIFFYAFATSLGLYILLAVASAFHIAFRERDVRYIFILPSFFALRHSVYGCGSLWGLIKLMLP